MKNTIVVIGLGLLVCITGCQALSGGTDFAIKKEDGGRGGSDPDEQGGAGSPGEAGRPSEAGSGGRAGQGGAGSGGASGNAGSSGTGGTGGNGIPPCEKAADSECALITDCGCEDGSHCQALGGDLKNTCVKDGDKALGDFCEKAEECEEGTCDQHVCRAYCEDGKCTGGKCVPLTGSDNKPVKKLTVCKASCQLDRKDACHEGISCLQDTDTKEAFCVAPANPCPSEENGICDAPDKCAAGTDVKDCSCEKAIPGAVCDLADQCGCDKSKTCRFIEGKASCDAPGPAGVDEFCDEHADCGHGLGCYGNRASGSICHKYCNDDADCPHKGDVCEQTYTRDASDKQVPQPGVKICLTACGDGLAECKAGTACTFNAEPKGTFCSPCTIELPGESCGLVALCGCTEEDKDCSLVSGDDNVPHARCVAKTPTAAVGQVCTADAECRHGAYCIDNLCRALCRGSGLCEGGTCNPVKLAGATAEIGYCTPKCTLGDASTCAAHTECKTVTPQGAAPHEECVLIPYTTDCPTMNGHCDGPYPQGSGLCPDGVDPECAMSTPAPTPMMLTVPAER